MKTALENSRCYPGDVYFIRGEHGRISVTIIAWKKSALYEAGWRWYLDEKTWYEILDKNCAVVSSGFATTLDQAQEQAEAALAELLAWRIEQAAKRVYQGRLFGGGQ
jgi:hypothetical protein